jgi:hypothetical protein
MTARVTARQYRSMPGKAEEPVCARCGRKVRVSRDSYDIFERMHYVCFHYEFEHDPYDPDEACAAGGCPSARFSTPPPAQDSTTG